jgi:hypothetical protein
VARPRAGVAPAPEPRRVVGHVAVGLRLDDDAEVVGVDRPAEIRSSTASNVPAQLLDVVADLVGDDVAHSSARSDRSPRGAGTPPRPRGSTAGEVLVAVGARARLAVLEEAAEAARR